MNIPTNEGAIKNAVKVLEGAWGNFFQKVPPYPHTTNFSERFGWWYQNACGSYCSVSALKLQIK